MNILLKLGSDSPVKEEKPDAQQSGLQSPRPPRDERRDRRTMRAQDAWVAYQGRLI